jgi:hypothetical protein
MWLLMVGVIVFWVVFWLWWNHNHVPAEEPAEAPAGGILRFIGSLVFGGFFLGLGVVWYLAAIFTGCFTFSYQRPVWRAAKTKLYFVNIVVLVLLALGVGFILAAFLGPVLVMLGLDVGLAHLLPVLLMIVGVQMVSLWVLIWSPLERQIIRKRLKAMGVTREQLHGAALVGLSNPASGFAKRFGMIEEDVGAMWVGPEVLVYRGDGEQFGIGREQLVQMERRADHRSTSVLGGLAHVILHVSLSDGSIRQIRLHTEGHWTMGGKRRAMDALADAIARWHAETPYFLTAETRRTPRF